LSEQGGFDMNLKISRSLYFALQFVRGEPVKSDFKDLMMSANHDLDELKEMQARRLLKLLRYSIENVPYYESKFQRHAGLIAKASTWKEVAELMHELPATTKADYFTHRDELESRMIRRIRTTPNITSGSSGHPVYFKCDNLSWAYRHASIFRTMAIHGVEIGEPYAYFFGLHWANQLRLKVRLKDFLFNRVRVSAFEINDSTFDRQYRALVSHGPTHWMGYPSAIYEFCVLAKARNASIEGLKAVFTTAEPLLDHQREVIESVCRCRCVNIYGSVEGGIGAFEGVEGIMHQSMETSHLYIGEDNALYTTDLFLYANPFIKYQVGDTCEPVEKDLKTNLAHEQIGFVMGRSGKPIVLPNGVKINANLPSYIFKNLAREGIIRRYQFCQFDSRIILLVIPTNPLKPKEKMIIQENCRSAFGEVPLEIREVSEIPLSRNAKHSDYVVFKDESEFHRLYKYADGWS